MKMKLVTKYMVASSHDIFGEDVVTDSSFYGSLDVDKSQLLVFVGQKHFDTEIEAVEFLNTTSDINIGHNEEGHCAWIIQKIFVWEQSKPVVINDSNRHIVEEVA